MFFEWNLSCCAQENLSINSWLDWKESLCHSSHFEVTSHTTHTRHKALSKSKAGKPAQAKPQLTAVTLEAHRCSSVLRALPAASFPEKQPVFPPRAHIAYNISTWPTKLSTHSTHLGISSAINLQELLTSTPPYSLLFEYPMNSFQARIRSELCTSWYRPWFYPAFPVSWLAWWPTVTLKEHKQNPSCYFSIKAGGKD